MFIDHYQMPVGFLETILMEKFEEMLGFWFELFFFLFVGLLVWFFPVDLFYCFDVIFLLSILTEFSANENCGKGNDDFC